MIHLERFCPFERVALLLSRYISSKQGESFDLILDGLSFRNLPVDKKQQDFQLGVGLISRQNFMMKPEVIGEVTVLDQGNVIATRKIRVINKLLTDKAEDFKLTVNASNGYENFCYPEARFTADRVSVNRQDGEIGVAVARPLFMYFIGRCSDEVIEILGPAPIKRYHTVGSAVVDGVSSRIIFEEDDSSDLEISPVKETKEVSGANKADVLLRHDNHTIPFVMSQSVYTFNGHRLSAELLLKIIKIVIHHERIGFKDQLIIDLEERFGKLYLSSEEEARFEQEILHDSIVNENFSFLACHNDYVMIEHDGKYGKLMGTSSASCFAISFAMMISSFVDGRLSTLLQTIKSCLEQKLMFINKQGVIEGLTRYIEGTPKSLAVPSLINPCTITLERKTSKQVPLDNGLVILGFDHAGGNLVQGEPDHYVVCLASAGKLYLVYDPLQKFVNSGVDMTSFLSQADSQILEFRRVDE